MDIGRKDFISNVDSPLNQAQAYILITLNIHSRASPTPTQQHLRSLARDSKRARGSFVLSDSQLLPCVLIHCSFIISIGPTGYYSQLGSSEGNDGGHEFDLSGRAADLLDLSPDLGAVGFGDQIG